MDGPGLRKLFGPCLYQSTDRTTTQKGQESLNHFLLKKIKNKEISRSIFAYITETWSFWKYQVPILRCELLCQTTEEHFLLLYPKISSNPISPQIPLKKSAEDEDPDVLKSLNASRFLSEQSPKRLSCEERLLAFVLLQKEQWDFTMEAGLNLLSSSSPFISRCLPRNFLPPSCSSSSSSSSSSGSICSISLIFVLSMGFFLLHLA